MGAAVDVNFIVCCAFMLLLGAMIGGFGMVHKYLEILQEQRLFERTCYQPSNQSTCHYCGSLPRNPTTEHKNKATGHHASMGVRDEPVATCSPITKQNLRMIEY